MSQFEYVSVALALLYSLVVARLLSAVPETTRKGARYGPHTAWVFVVLFATAVTWWSVWSLREVAWTALRFVWILTVPGLIHLRAGILVSGAPASVESWQDHFYENRVPFFVVGAVQGANAILIPWIMGVVPWLSPSPAHAAGISALVICGVGLSTANPVVHRVLVAVNSLMLVFFLMLVNPGSSAG